MRWLLRFSILLLLILALLTGVTRLLGQSQPNPALIDMLHLTECAPPCWIGIVPGKTTLTEARTRIINVFGQSGYLLTFDLISAPGLAWINVEQPADPIGILLITLTAHDNRVVDTITFDFSSIYLRDRIYLADVINLLGSPSRVMLPVFPARGRQAIGEFALLYDHNQNGLMATALLSDPVDWQQEVQLLVVYRRGQLPVGPFSQFQPWHGFSSLDQYYSRLR
jgi:hypothetical protein